MVGSSILVPCSSVVVSNVSNIVLVNISSRVPKTTYRQHWEKYREYIGKL